MKKCNCGVENPNDARFCGGCGSEFQIIKWRETVLIKTRSFGWYFVNILLGYFAIYAIILTIAGFVYRLQGDREAIVYLTLGPIMLILSAPLLIKRIISRNKQTKELRSIASNMEDTYSRYKLITKAGKYGLYDWKKKKVILRVEYNSIERQNDFYYTVSKGNKYGIYSRLLNRIIVPIEYDAVTLFVNNVASITKGNVTKQVDTQGNIF